MADMLPVVADTHFDRLCAVDDYTSFIWTTRYYEPGDFELTVPMSSHNLQFLQVNNYVMRGDDDGEMGIIERREVTQDLNGQETMTVSGRFLSSILARRIIAQQTQVSGTIAHCVSQLINVSAINPSDTARKLPIRIGTLDIPATQMQQQFTGTNLLEAIVNICKTYFVGFSLHYDADGGGMVFDMFTGVDRSYAQSENTYAVFSSEYGNLQSSDYVEDASAVVTNVLVAGEGEGLERKTIWASKGNPTGLSRYELFQDARNASTNNGAISDSVYYKQLQDEGAESLADMEQMFAGQVTFDGIEFGTDLNIGDICTIESVSWGMYMDARIVEVIESVGETGAYTITPSFEAVSTQDVLRDAALLTERGNIQITSESGARLLAQTRALSATGGEVKISELEEATTLNDDDAVPVATGSATLKATMVTLASKVQSLLDLSALATSLQALFTTATNSAKGLMSAADKTKLDAVGISINKDISTAVSVPTGTWKSIGSIDIAAGKWVLIYTAQFGSNATGRRVALLNTTADVQSAAYLRASGFSSNAVNGGSTYLGRSMLHTATSDETMHLNVWHNAGASLNVWGNIRAVRIK